MRITGHVHDGDTACGGGVTVLVRKGSSDLWKQAIRNGDTAGSNFDVSSTVLKNDTIDFVINKGEDGFNRCDSTVFIPTLILSSPGQ